MSKSKSASLEALPQRRLRHQLNYVPSEKEKEHPTGVSMTVPNEVLTPAEMLQRYTRGLPLPTYAEQPVYSDEELPNIQAMDLDELHDYHMALTDEIAGYKKALQEKEENKEKAKLKAQLLAELKAQEQEYPKPPSAPAPGQSPEATN